MICLNSNAATRLSGYTDIILIKEDGELNQDLLWF
jgi:hypothetical protein